MLNQSVVPSIAPLTYCPLTMGEQTEKCTGCKVKLSVPEGPVPVVAPFDEGFFRAIPHGPVPFIQEMLSLNEVQGYFSYVPSIRDWLKENIHEAGLGRLEQVLFIPFVNLSGGLKFWPITFTRERIEQCAERYQADLKIVALAQKYWVSIEQNDVTGLSWGEVRGCEREVEWSAQEVNDAFIRAEFNNNYIDGIDHPFIRWALSNGEGSDLSPEVGDYMSGHAAKGVH